MFFTRQIFCRQRELRKINLGLIKMDHVCKMSYAKQQSETILITKYFLYVAKTF